jgi:putative membrane protein
MKMMMGMSGMWFGMIGMWFIFLFIAFAVYHDAERLGRNDGLLWLILLLIPWMNLLVLLAYLVVRENGSSAQPQSTNAITFLENRYARGEISREEFYRMKNDIIGGYDQ